MTKYAQLNPANDAGEQTVFDLTEIDPNKAFHPEIAARFVEVPDEANLLSYLKDGNWTHPEIEPDEPVEEMLEPTHKTVLDRVEFKNLFTISERVAIRAAREYSGEDEGQLMLKYTLVEFYDVLDDPQLEQINIEAPEVTDGLDALQAGGFITAERRTEIGKGKPL